MTTYKFIENIPLIKQPFVTKEFFDYILHRDQNSNNIQLVFNVEYDSNCTEFEHLSNKGRLALRTGTPSAAPVLMEFLRVIIDRYPQYDPEPLVAFGLTCESEDNETEGFTFDQILGLPWGAWFEMSFHPYRFPLHFNLGNNSFVDLDEIDIHIVSVEQIAKKILQLNGR